MGIMRDKFLELCKKNNVTPDYEKHMDSIYYRIREGMPAYYVFPSRHEVRKDLDDKPEVLRTIIEFNQFVDELFKEKIND